MPKQYGLSCPVAQSLEFLGERWTLLVVRDLLSGPKKFQDLQASLAGVAPAVLSERLKVLESHGIVSRAFYSQHPPRAEYTLTERGLELRTVIGALAVWGSRHVHTESALVHEACEQRLDVTYYCGTCDRRVAGSEVRMRKTAPRAARLLRERQRRVARS